MVPFLTRPKFDSGLAYLDVNTFEHDIAHDDISHDGEYPGMFDSMDSTYMLYRAIPIPARQSK